ncbi:hypothetical protein RHO15_09550 [Utexia brackfieldae]
MKKLTDDQVKAILQEMAECSERISESCAKIGTSRQLYKKAA